MHIGSSSKMPATSPDAPFIVSLDAHVPERHGLDARLHLLGHARAVPDAEDRLLRGPGRLDALRARAGRQAVGRALRQQLRHRRCPNPPTSYIPGRVYGCIFDDETGLRNRDVIGMDQICFETDYPHADSTFPHSKKVATDICTRRASTRARPTSCCAATPSRPSASSASASRVSASRRAGMPAEAGADARQGSVAPRPAGSTRRDPDLGGEVASARAVHPGRAAPGPRGRLQPLVRARPLLRRLHDRAVVLRRPALGRDAGPKDLRIGAAGDAAAVRRRPRRARTWRCTGCSRAARETPTGRPARCTGCTRNGRMFPERDHIHTLLYRYGGPSARDADGVPRRAGARPPVPGPGRGGGRAARRRGADAAPAGRCRGRRRWRWCCRSGHPAAPGAPVTQPGTDGVEHARAAAVVRRQRAARLVAGGGRLRRRGRRVGRRHRPLGVAVHPDHPGHRHLHRPALVGPARSVAGRSSWSSSGGSFELAGAPVAVLTARGWPDRRRRSEPASRAAAGGRAAAWAGARRPPRSRSRA